MRLPFGFRGASPVCGLLALVSCLACGCGTVGGHVMNESGVSYYNRGDYGMARREFHKAVAINPQNTNYWHNLAAVMKRQGDIPGAEATWRRALSMDATHQPSYHGLAELLVETGREGDAYTMLETWAGTQPYSPEPHMELAWIRSRMGDTIGAEQSLQQALHLQPSNPIAMAQLGELYQQTGQTGMAVTMLQRSLHQDWDQPKVQAQLAQLTGHRHTTGRPMNPHQYAARPLGPQMPQQQMAMLPPHPHAQQQWWGPQRPTTTYHPMPQQVATQYLPPTYSHSAAPMMMQPPMMMHAPQAARGMMTAATRQMSPRYTAAHGQRQAVLLHVDDPLTPATSRSLAPSPNLAERPQRPRVERGEASSAEQVIPASGTSSVPGPVLFIPTTSSTEFEASDEAAGGIPVTSAF